MRFSPKGILASVRSMAIRAASNADAAQWAADALTRQETDETSLWTALGRVPDRYEAYARVLHRPPLLYPDVNEAVERFEREHPDAGPRERAAALSAHVDKLQRQTSARRSWAAIAESNGRVAHPLMLWHEIAAGEPHAEQYDYGWEMEPDEVAALARILANYTEPNERCTFLIWEGLNKGALYDLRAPKVTLEDQPYLVLEGELADAPKFEWRWRSSEAWPTSFHPPNAWWPESRRWFAGFGIDDDCTFVGGPAGLVKQLEEASDLEVYPVQRSDRLGAAPRSN